MEKSYWLHAQRTPTKMELRAQKLEQDCLRWLCGTRIERFDWLPPTELIDFRSFSLALV